MKVNHSFLIGLSLQNYQLLPIVCFPCDRALELTRCIKCSELLEQISIVHEGNTFLQRDKKILIRLHLKLWYKGLCNFLQYVRRTLRHQTVCRLVCWSGSVALPSPTKPIQVIQRKESRAPTTPGVVTVSSIRRDPRTLTIKSSVLWCGLCFHPYQFFFLPG